MPMNDLNHETQSYRGTRQELTDKIKQSYMYIEKKQNRNRNVNTELSTVELLVSFNSWG